MADLSVQLQKIRQQQDDERRRLLELRNMLRAAAPQDKEVSSTIDLLKYSYMARGNVLYYFNTLMYLPGVRISRRVLPPPTTR